MQGLDLALLPPGDPLSVPGMLLHLALGAGLSIVLRWHFGRFGSTLANRSEFAQVFPLLVLTTILIITVVKSSLALSLGLVGALSIVRFRTPIKEPEELAYLFLAIGIGVGLGAQQVVPTILATGVILGVTTALRWSRRERENTNLYLSLDWRGDVEGETPLDAIQSVVQRHSELADLRRLDSRDGNVELTFFVDLAGPLRLAGLVKDLQESFPGIGVTFIDPSQLPSV